MCNCIQLQWKLWIGKLCLCIILCTIHTRSVFNAPPLFSVYSLWECAVGCPLIDSLHCTVTVSNILLFAASPVTVPSFVFAVATGCVVDLLAIQLLLYAVARIPVPSQVPPLFCTQKL